MQPRLSSLAAVRAVRVHRCSSSYLWILLIHPNAYSRRWGFLPPEVRQCGFTDHPSGSTNVQRYCDGMDTCARSQNDTARRFRLTLCIISFHVTSFRSISYLTGTSYHYRRPYTIPCMTAQVASCHRQGQSFCAGRAVSMGKRYQISTRSDTMEITPLHIRTILQIIAKGNSAEVKAEKGKIVIIEVKRRLRETGNN